MAVILSYSQLELVTDMHSGFLQEYKDKVPQAVVDAVNTEIANVRTVMDSGKADQIREKVSALQQALMKIGESMSKPGDSQAPPQGDEPGDDKKEGKGP